MAGGCHRRNKAGAGDRQVTWLSPDCDIMDKNIGAGKVGLATAFDKRSLVLEGPPKYQFQCQFREFLYLSNSQKHLTSTSSPRPSRNSCTCAGRNSAL